MGRFTQPDTIVPNPYNPQDLNRYSYCNNNPINYTDPTGHSWKSFWKRWGDYLGLGGSFINASNTGDWQRFGRTALITLAATVASFGTAAFASAFIAPAMAGLFSSGGTVAISAFQNAIITGTEFGISGFAGGFAGTLAGGGSLEDAFKSGGIGFGIGFATGDSQGIHLPQVCKMAFMGLIADRTILHFLNISNYMGN